MFFSCHMHELLESAQLILIEFSFIQVKAYSNVIAVGEVVFHSLKVSANKGKNEKVLFTHLWFIRYDWRVLRKESRLTHTEKSLLTAFGNSVQKKKSGNYRSRALARFILFIQRDGEICHGTSFIIFFLRQKSTCSKLNTMKCDRKQNCILSGYTTKLLQYIGMYLSCFG